MIIMRIFQTKECFCFIVRYFIFIFVHKFILQFQIELAQVNREGSFTLPMSAADLFEVLLIYLRCYRRIVATKRLVFDIFYLLSRLKGRSYEKREKEFVCLFVAG
jgi:hypothetical protein